MKSMGEWRKANMRNTILHIIRSEGKASKFQLQKATRYSMTTVLAAIDDLAAANLINSAGKGDSNGGRRPEYFILNPEGGYFIGIEFNVLAVSGAAINFCGETTDTRRVNLDRSHISPARLTQAVIDMVEDLYAPLRAAGCRCFGIGVGIPGLLDYKAGVDLAYNDLTASQGVPIRRALEKRFGLPVYLDHNVNTIALAYSLLEDEHQDGDFVLLSIRKGIRASAIINGQLLRGRNNSSGEIGHIPVPGNPRMCVCGRKGCLDTLASSEGIAIQLQEGVRHGRFEELFEMVGRDPARLTIVSFVDSVLAGHQGSLEFLEEICDHLAYALTELVNILNPPKIVIYGELTRIGDPLLDSLRQRLEYLSFYTNVRNLQIVPARLNYAISAIGAAALVMTSAFPYVSVMSDVSSIS